MHFGRNLEQRKTPRTGRSLRAKATPKSRLRFRPWMFPLVPMSRPDFARAVPCQSASAHTPRGKCLLTRTDHRSRPPACHRASRATRIRWWRCADKAKNWRVPPLVEDSRSTPKSWGQAVASNRTAGRSVAQTATELGASPSPTNSLNSSTNSCSESHIPRARNQRSIHSPNPSLS